MDKGYICLSFDDGRIDNYTKAFPILKKYNIPATFNITTGYVCKKSNKWFFTDKESMSIKMLKEISCDGSMEIAGHGYWHQNSLDDIILGMSELRLLLDSDVILNGFASPGTELDMNLYNSNRAVLKKNGVEYVRLSLHYNSYPHIKTLIRKLSRILPIPLFYRLAYQDTLMDKIHDDILYSVPVLSSISISQLKSLISYACKKKRVCILMLHSIVDDGEVHDNWDFEISKFENLCHFLSDTCKNNQLEIITTQKAHRLLINKK